MTIKKIAMIGFEQANALDITGPMEVFASANSESGASQLYEIGLYSFDGKAFTVSSGITLVPLGDLSAIPEDCDTLIVAGGDGVQAFTPDSELVQWLKQNSGKYRRIVSICTGAFLFAYAGLLSGKKATTHWIACPYLEDMYPDIELEENAIYTRDGNLYTSAGVTTGIDLCLSLVEEDHGHALAMSVAKLLVLYLHRPGGQRQFSQVLQAQHRSGGEFDDILLWINDKLDQSINIECMAEHACLSPRQFNRRFQQAFGVTPMRYIAQLRLEKSRLLLEKADYSIKQIARDCGYQSGETLRRQFSQHYGISPQEYQQRFISI
ncbi:MAG: GlxA family transcriptional regulator [Pseudomonadales bacterium]|nr:GlxA family transcriptional regulator [Pseudomonadales bacterium]